MDILTLKKAINYTNREIGLKNLIKNGDFSDGTSHFFRPGDGPLTLFEGYGTRTFRGSASVQSYQWLDLTPGHYYYVKADCKWFSGDKVVSHQITLGRVGAGLTSGVMVDAELGVVQTLSTVIEAQENWNAFIYAARIASNEDVTTGIKNVMVIDLTETFGVGNEPDKETLDFIINQLPNGWFGNVSSIPKLVSSLVFRTGLEKRSLDLEFEAGGLNASNGRIDVAEIGGNFDVTRRTGNFLKVVPGTELNLDSTNGKVYVFEYDKQFGFVKKTEILEESPLLLSRVTEYVKLQIGDFGDNAEARITFYTDKGYPLWVKNPNSLFNMPARGNINFVYEVFDDESIYYNGGVLKLPPNYSHNGKPVRAIFFSHGSSGIPWTNNNFGAYENYVQYLADEGYAVFDCWDYTTKYSHLTGGADFGTPIATTSIIQCYKWLVKNFNILDTGVFTSGKSSAGFRVLNLYGKGMPILACGLLAPAISPRFRGRVLGYGKNGRLQYANEFGFTGDTENLLGQEEYLPAITEDMKEYLRENLPKTVGYYPMWNGLVGATIEELIEAEINRDSNTHELYKSLYRVCPVPTKMWVARDDTVITIEDIESYVQSIKNAHGVAEVRWLPENTGGHNATDTAPEALRVDSITTKLGITHTDIPLAYVELIQWFRRFES